MIDSDPHSNTSESMSPQTENDDTVKKSGDDTQTAAAAATNETAVEDDDTAETAELMPEIPREIIPTGKRRTEDKQNIAVMAAKRCGMGAVRDRNEDFTFVFVAETGGHFSIVPLGLFIVADGMGGHTNGHVASSVAARVAAHHVLTRLYLPMLESDKLANQAPIQEVLDGAVQAANRMVYETEPEIDSGTTLTIALILGRRLHVAHVGDSRLYLYNQDRLEPITNDHSLVQRLQDVGQLTPEEAKIYHYRNVLLRAVGQGEEVEIDTYMRLLPKQGRLLLCTDGLCGFVSDESIKETLDLQLPPKETADALYDAAMQAGGYDNITAVVVDFKF